MSGLEATDSSSLSTGKERTRFSQYIEGMRKWLDEISRNKAFPGRPLSAEKQQHMHLFHSYVGIRNSHTDLNTRIGRPHYSLDIGTFAHIPRWHFMHLGHALAHREMTVSQGEIAMSYSYWELQHGTARPPWDGPNFPLRCGLYAVCTCGDTGATANKGLTRFPFTPHNSSFKVRNGDDGQGTRRYS